MNKITKYYNDLIKIANEEGVEVIHRRTKKYLGACYAHKDHIRISSHIRNTLFGAFILGHELGHWVDYKDRKYLAMDYYKHFYSSYYFKRVPKNYIRYMEQSATQFSADLLRSRKFDVSKIPDLNKKFFEKELMPVSIKCYNFHL